MFDPSIEVCNESYTASHSSIRRLGVQITPCTVANEKDYVKVPCLVVYLTEIRTVYHVLFLCYNVYSVPNCTCYFLWFRDLRLERLSPFFFFFFCFFFCYFVFIFFKTFKAFPEIGLLILLVSFSIFLYLIVTSFSESRNDLCPYFSSLSANRSVKFHSFN